MEDCSKYNHSPAHFAVFQRDHATLKKLIASLPRLAKAGTVKTEAESLSAEQDADTVSAIIDRRDVPRRETPLHLAVRLKDPISADILMAAGADWSLQNEHGWSALQEAVCNREENIAMIIARHYQPLAWAKWCRRLPRIISSANRIRDFYMEITFHFESSVIPFIGRVAPSDTYRIWKRGSRLRADMTLAGFDGFRIQRSDQTFLFLGDGYEDGNVSLPSGSLIVLSHKDKEITNALEGAGVHPSEPEVAHEVALMAQTNMYRPGIDVTRAELVPNLNWRRVERVEPVGPWKSKVYDMLNVMVSVKSRRVPGAMTDEELFSNDKEIENDEYDDVLTPEEKMQLNSALRVSENVCEERESGDKDKNKSWFGWNKKGSKTGGNDDVDDLKNLKNVNKKKKKKGNTDTKHESEYKKGVRPVLWLTPDFPLKTEEILPLLDILANKVKAVRRLRELLTTKLPHGTFPVKIAIPIVPTIRVVVTFTKLEELQASSEEFSTPLSSPAHFQDSKSKEPEGSSSWMSWMKGTRGDQSMESFRAESDPFHIPAGYTWVDANEKKRRMKVKKAKMKKHKKQSVGRNGENGGRVLSEDLE